jgi:short-subunit dehydrogenase
VFLPLLGTKENFKHKAGKIINISSISGILNTPMNGAYCVSKHALESMAEVYRRELMMYDIKVSSIQPGPIESKLWEKNIGTLQEYYKGDYENMARNTDKIILEASKDALNAKVISKLIHNIIKNKSPKPSYIVSKNSFLINIISRFTPRKIVDMILRKTLSKAIQN